jgi:hypothetical protein
MPLSVRLVSGLVALLALVACGDSNQNTYAQAISGTAIMVTAVGIHRAITDDCWARCSPGYLCNEKSGLCEPGECVPACEFGDHCVHQIGGGYRCVQDANPTVTSEAMTTLPATRVPR